MSGRPWEIVVGDVRRVLRDMPAVSFDAAFADPPYGISMGGARWDYDVPSVNVFVEVLRVLKPGAYSFFFGGTRTFHRMAVNIEDAGFFPVDLCLWLYGSGLGKSVDVGKMIDRMKDTREEVLQITRWIREVSRRKRISNADINEHFDMVGMAGHWTTLKSQPLVPTAEQWPRLLKLLGEEPSPEIKALADKINREKGRPGDAWFAREKIGEEERVSGSYAPSKRATTRMRDITLAAQPESARWSGYGNLLKPAWEPIGLFLKMHEGSIAENVIKHGVGGLDVDACRIPVDKGKPRFPANVAFDEEAGAMLDQQSGNRRGMSGGGKHRVGYRGGMFGAIDSTTTARGDQGGASRFFYSTKVSREERDRGLDDFEAPEDGGAKNGHLSLKPIDLCRCYARMLLPPPRADGKPRRILVPWSGTSSEMIGALQAGWDEVVGIELVPKHAEWARARIAKGQIIRHAK